MGCGKSKHDVASGNTVLQCKKCRANSKENGAETKDKNNNNVDNLNPRVEMKQKEGESVKEFGVVAKADEGNNEKTNVQEEGREVMVQSEESEGGKDDDSLKENDEKVNDADTAQEKKPAENEKDTAEEKKAAENDKEEGTLAKEEEDIQDTSVSTPEGEEKDLKAEEGQ